jgi:hypothetical protein
MQTRSPQSTFGEKEGQQIKNRVFIKQPPPEEKVVEDKEASSDTPAIMGKDEKNVATLAYALFEQRGREDGHDLDDWLEAEQRLVSWGQDRGF